MSFESGSVSFRAFYVPRGLPEDAIEKFAKQALPPLESIGREGASGWVTGRHMLDRNINGDTARLGGYLRLCFVTAEKKIHEALLKAECRIEEIALMQAEGIPFVKRAERIRIRKEVMLRLQPSASTMLSGIPMVYDSSRRMAYASAASEKKCDAFCLEFERASGSAAVVVGAETAAKSRRKIDVNRFGSVSFSPNVKDDDSSMDVGQDFLTWLWFYSEARGGMAKVDGSDYGIAIAGPITLFHELDGAHVVMLKDGSPTASSEVKPALLGGKKLCKAKIMVARADEAWEAVFDARSFAFGGLKIPKSKEKLDDASRFQQRVVSLGLFMEVFLSFYDKFLADRSDDAVWHSTKKDIVQWVMAKK